MDDSKINMGVIGANIHLGWGGNVHLPALTNLPEYRVAAVCTSRGETAKEAAQHFDVPMAFHDYGEMVAHPEVEAVSVCVRVPLHHEMVMAALEAGKHVYCEWPLGVTVAEAEEMAGKAREKGVVHMVGLQLRNNPALLRLKELIAEGYVGEVLSVRMEACVSTTPDVHPGWHGRWTEVWALTCFRFREDIPWTSSPTASGSSPSYRRRFRRS